MSDHEQQSNEVSECHILPGHISGANFPEMVNRMILHMASIDNMGAVIPITRPIERSVLLTNLRSLQLWNIIKIEKI